MELSVFQKILAELFILIYMFSVGLVTTTGMVLNTLKETSLTARALLLNFVIIPLIGLALTYLFTLPMEVKIGLILLSISPGGLFTLNFVRVSNGNINLAIALLCLFSALSIVLTPFLAYFLLEKTHELLFSFWIMLRLFILILIPLYLGRFLAIYIPNSRKLAAILGILSIIIFIIFNLLTSGNKSQALDVLGWNGILMISRGSVEQNSRNQKLGSFMEKNTEKSFELSSRQTGMSFQRTRMSADRTLMSVIRTSLSLISFGFTIFQFFSKLGTSNVMPVKESAARNDLAPL